MKVRSPRWTEAVTAIAAVAAILWGMWEHRENVQQAATSASHNQIVETIKMESVERKAADDELRQIVYGQTKSMSTIIAQMKIVLARLHLDGEGQD